MGCGRVRPPRSSPQSAGDPLTLDRATKRWECGTAYELVRVQVVELDLLA